MDRYDTSGIIREGALKVRHRERFDQAMKEMPVGEVIISIRHARATRSLVQNALYWSGYIAPLAEYTGYSAIFMHAYLKKRFLTPTHLIISDPNGVIVDETDLEPTTTTLTKNEFAMYLMNVEEFALSLGVTVGPKVAEYAHE